MGTRYIPFCCNKTWPKVKDKLLEKQLKKEDGWNRESGDFSLHFRIRFWPRKPAEEAHLDLQDILYRQIREDIARGRLQVQGQNYDSILVTLGALQQQIEFGDTPGDQSISMEANLTPIDLNDRVIDAHRLGLNWTLCVITLC